DSSPSGPTTEPPNDRHTDSDRHYLRGFVYLLRKSQAAGFTTVLAVRRKTGRVLAADHARLRARRRTAFAVQHDYAVLLRARDRDLLRLADRHGRFCLVLSGRHYRRHAAELAGQPRQPTLP